VIIFAFKKTLELYKAASITGRSGAVDALFLHAYGHYLRGEMNEALATATECARRASAVRRNNLPELLELPNNEYAF
jgi:hypothetical protein